MKLATALSQRADLQKRTAELNTRLRNNAKVQDGEQPAEKPAELLKELDAVLLQLEELVARINLTNSSTVFEGKTVTELIARRDMLSKKLGILRGFLDEASSKIARYSRAEIKIVSTV
ncbi:MAG: DIP1984 family protein, partial [Firmicutes bacterium]|nr:DIP1984 family protein [Bacillota bacterium]